MPAGNSAFLVDDDASIRGLIKAEFAAESVTVEEAGDCRGARERLQGEPTSIVFLDLQLPDGA